ncbi:hypothetical protein [Bacillus ndiopicus]|uniref:hypothetical protein n=1 Tax=Bacillus ndiopicus TaxID=1347368 RepID=UPI0005A7196D|nr:hypothetical protein [Bacillus ndiopicus]
MKTFDTSRNGKAYTEEERIFLDTLAEVLEDRQEMEKISPYIAAGMRRTVSGIQGQIEKRKGWFFTE